MVSYEEAVAVQRRIQDQIMALPGVTGIAAKMRSGRPILEVSVDPAAEIPTELTVDALDGVALVVERRRYEIQ